MVQNPSILNTAQTGASGVTQSVRAFPPRPAQRPELCDRLLTACGAEKVFTVDLLLEQGASTNCMDNEGRTPLIIVSYTGHSAIAEMLIKKGADVNYSDHNGVTPLISASMRGNIEIVRLLLTKNPDVNACDKFGRTALMMAKTRGGSDVVELLEKHGAR